MKCNAILNTCNYHSHLQKPTCFSLSKISIILTGSMLIFYGCNSTADSYTVLQKGTPMAALLLLANYLPWVTVTSHGLNVEILEKGRLVRCWAHGSSFVTLRYRPYPWDHFALRHSLPDGKSARCSLAAMCNGCKRRGMKGSSARFFRFSEAPNLMIL